MSFAIDINHIPICVSVFKKEDNDFIFVDCNKKAEEVDNLSKDLLLGKKLLEIFPDAKDIGFFDALLRVEKTGKGEILYLVFYKDNRISGFRKNEIVKLPNGTIAAFYSDTNEEKKLELILEEQRNIFQKFMNDSKVISVQGYNENHEVIYWNKASEIIYGYQKEEAIGKRLEDLIIPETMQSLVYENIENWIHNDIEIPSSELTLKDKNSNDVHVFSQHRMIQVSSTKKEMYCIDIDLSSTKELEQELLKEKNFLRTMFKVIPDLIWLKDTKGKYLSCNEQFEHFFGAKEQEIIGKTDFDFVDKNQAKQFTQDDKTAMKSQSPLIVEEYIKFKDGSYEGYFETIKTRLKDSGEKTIGVLGVARDITMRKNYENQLLIFTHTDILTGLSNRAVLMDRLNQLVNHRKSKDRHCSVLFIDIDNFKDINDAKGHDIGDKVLIEISKRLKSIVRKGDTVARLGGDEFVILLEQIATSDDAKLVAKKTLEHLYKPMFINNYKLEVSASIGISIFPDDSIIASSLLSQADKAMYYAKRNGKNSFAFYSDLKDNNIALAAALNLS